MSGNYPKSSDLPSLLAELAEIVGVEAVLTLAAAKGGVRVYIPSQLLPGHWLSELLGSEKAQAICEYFRQSVTQQNEQSMGWVGAHVLIPGAISLRRQMLFEQAFRDGLSISETAIRLGVSERAISYYRAARRRRANRHNLKNAAAARSGRGLDVH